MVKTESIKYIGSKTKLLWYIVDIINKVFDNNKNKVIIDWFSGSVRVWQALKNSWFSVIANDVSSYSRIFWDCYLKNKKERKYYQKIIDKLNLLLWKEWWFTKNYWGIDNNGSSIQCDGKKRIRQKKNTKKLDSILEYITKNYSGIELSVLKTSLILALDKVDSSLWHQVSYLKDWSKRSYKDLFLEVPKFIITGNEDNNKIISNDIFKTIETEEFDLAYFDPPYWSNNDKMPATRVRYWSYYHIWNTISIWDKPELTWKANRRVDSWDKINPSKFEEFRKNEKWNFLVEDYFKELFKNTMKKTNYILFSYNNNGRMSLDSFYKILEELWLNNITFKIPYKKNVMATMVSNLKRVNKGENYEILTLICADKLWKENTKKLFDKVKNKILKSDNIFLGDINLDSIDTM